MPSLRSDQRCTRLRKLLQFRGISFHPVRREDLLSSLNMGGVADPEGALQQGKRLFSLPFFSPVGNVIERLFPPGLSEPRPVRTFTLIAAGVPVRGSDPAETRHSATSAIPLPAQYPSGLPVHLQTYLAWTWSDAEANQAMADGDKAGAQRHESMRSTNAQFILYCSCCPAGSRPPPRHQRFGFKLGSVPSRLRPDRRLERQVQLGCSGSCLAQTKER